MGFWHKISSWARQNPDRSVPAALLLLIAVVAGLLIWNARPPSGAVPPYGALAQPDAPAIEIRGVKGGNLTISRRALASWQEFGAKQMMGPKKLPAEVEELLGSQDSQLLMSSVTEFCRTRKEMLLETPRSNQASSSLQAGCTAVETSAAQEKSQAYMQLLALAEVKRKGLQLKASDLVKKDYSGLLKRSTGEVSLASALEASGLTFSDLDQKAQMVAAMSELQQQSAPALPDRGQVEEFYQSHLSDYGRPAQAVLAAWLFDSKAKAQAASEALKADSSAKIEGSEQTPTKWISASMLPASQRGLIEGPVGGVSDPMEAKEEGASDSIIGWRVVLVKQTRPSLAAPALSEIFDKVDNDLQAKLAYSAQLSLRKILVRRWADQSYCDAAISDQAQLTECSKGSEG
jgi:hypothetical protein